MHATFPTDALAPRYGWSLRGVPTHCAYGAQFSVEHELSCPKGGFTILRHNEVRDLTANILSEVCHNVCTEPSLQPLTSEQLTGASAIIMQPDWILQRTGFGVTVMNGLF